MKSIINEWGLIVGLCIWIWVELMNRISKIAALKWRCEGEEGRKKNQIENDTLFQRRDLVDSLSHTHC